MIIAISVSKCKRKRKTVRENYSIMHFLACIYPIITHLLE